jgi:hypothetical protein
MAYLGPGLVLLASAASLVLASEIGFALGKRQRGNLDPDGRSQISIVEGALLGLLGLLLGFTFSMAVGRFDTRQDLVVREANAVGTVFLRCDSLPPEVQEKAKAKLRQYVDLRLEASRTGDDESLVEILKKASSLQSEVWGMAMDEARLRPTGIASGLISALNELFDLGEARVAAFKNQVPAGVWVVLYVVAVLTVGSLGYGSGLTGHRMVLPVTLVPALMSIILTLLVDLGHPRHGLIRVSQESMIRVRDSLK